MILTGEKMPDILELLENQHREVEQLFAQYDQAQEDKSAIVAQVTEALQLHTTIEEEILYPVLRERLANGEEKADHAIEEHDLVDSVLDQLEAEPSNEGAFADLREKVTHHVAEEEHELFPELRESVDQAQLDEMAQRAEALK